MNKNELCSERCKQRLYSLISVSTFMQNLTNHFKKTDMKIFKQHPFLIAILFFLCNQNTYGQPPNYPLSIDISVDKKLLKSFKEKGRLFIFMSLDSVSEPRTQTWPNPFAKTEIFAKNIDKIDL